ncbi:MAG: vanillate O-demethylase oxidoreductase VanB [Sorangiineae bacterium NIC37A_2]|jgi:uncharacterized protein YndB with AHSA1/START domain|nr:MAG: vanillate O-demethylase oxidoreductase VanB [Sorangiineae bacterium NIC37A_2]
MQPRGCGIVTDKIEKTKILKAPLAKVWRALSDSEAFGTWFGMKLEGPFVEGQTVYGAIAMTQVDDEIAKYQEPYVGVRCELRIEKVVPLRLFSFRWHPGGDPDVGPNAPMTLVTFEIEEAPEGTRLTIVESGFEAIPLERRAKAFSDNEGGWEAQLSLIAKYLARES